MLLDKKVIADGVMAQVREEKGEEEDASYLSLSPLEYTRVQDSMEASRRHLRVSEERRIRLQIRLLDSFTSSLANGGGYKEAIGNACQGGGIWTYWRW